MKTYAGRMTRTYAARKLLEHGPLTQPEFLEITGWKPIEVNLVTQRLMQTGDVIPVNLLGKRHYALALLPTARGFPPSIGHAPSTVSTGITSCFHGSN